MRGWGGVFPLLLILGVALGCGGSDEEAPPDTEAAVELVEPDARPEVGNIILIVIDTLRADAIGAFARANRGTPVLDRLAREGVYFEQATSTSSYTRESVFSLFTGLLAGPMGQAGWDSSPVGDMQTIPLQMRCMGRFTAMASASMMIDLPGFRRGSCAVRGLPRTLCGGANAC